MLSGTWKIFDQAARALSGVLHDCFKESPQVNIKFLETFVWVARLKSFRLTAEKLFTTQASISSRIAALEDEMGVRLFVRDSKGVSLTSEGQRVLE